MKIHLIGIGGTSMSGLAVFLKKLGHQVSGCDVEKTREMKEAKKEGIPIEIGHSKEHIKKDLDQVIYTSAIKEDSPGWREIQKAREMGIKTLKRAGAIGEITKNYFVITISGTHGKTTTSAMIAEVLLKNNFNPSFLLGAPLPGAGSVRVGKGEYLVLEADEFDRSFHCFKSNLAVILNIDRDHLDYFKGGIEEIKESFKEFIEKNVRKNGTIIYFKDDKNIEEIVKSIKKNDLKFVPFEKDEARDIPILQAPGFFNRLNALGATKAGLEIGIAKENIRRVLKDFSGVMRRFEKKGEKNNVIVIDDYAHHPTAIKKTLKAARKKFKGKRIIIVFHALHHSRTRLLFEEFSKSFYGADLVIVTKICYGEGRENLGKISEEKLAKAISKESKVKTEKILDFGDVVDFLNKKTKKEDVVITMGAYPVREIGEKFLKK